MDLYSTSEISLIKFSSFDPDSLPIDSVSCHLERSKEVLLSWKDVSYEVYLWTEPWKLWLSPTKPKTILHQSTGSISSGSLTALMGPSGSGKSTLLNCISGKIDKTGMTGEVSLTSSSSNLRIAFVPQENHLYEAFTVYELLIFASRMNNGSFSWKQHESRVNEVLDSLDLNSCLNLPAKKLSGGQRKRVCIGVELISRPEILFMDEPTSGLDSDNSEKLVSLLRNLVSKSTNMRSASPAIMLSIHQPSGEVFKMFDTVYLLDKFGGNIYTGNPCDIVSFLQSFEFQWRVNTNPAEFAIEVANAKFGTTKLDQMRRITKDTSHEFVKQRKMQINCLNEIPVESQKFHPSCSTWEQTWLMFQRNLSATYIKTTDGIYKIILMWVFSCLIFSLGQVSILKDDGCWNPSTSKTEDSNENERMDINFMKHINNIIAVTVVLCAVAMFQMFYFGVTGIFSFHHEIQTVSKEICNSWYSTTSYFLAKTSSDAITTTLSSAICVFYVFTFADLPFDSWTRVIALFIAYFSISCLWESRGQFSSIICLYDPRFALCICVQFAFFFIFCSDFYVPPARMNFVHRFLHHFSDVKWFSSMTIISFFGFDRCPLTQDNDLKILTEFTSQGMSLRKTLSTVWTAVDIKPGIQLSTYEVMINVPKGYLSPVIEAANKFFGSESTVSKSTEVCQYHESSYIMAFFSERDQYFLYYFMCMAIAILSMKVMIWLALNWRTQVRRL